ncbi:Integrator complex subunit 2 [Coemansia biformis]|uniref:Integrator complex subunit 2 n=1 Tax=Coemansia biformis TaxID=1286918 RepID=A0A9W7YCZ0_9FUNG|nr:Integrator complex subunit 2 [Coemansia biformis]
MVEEEEEDEEVIGGGRVDAGGSRATGSSAGDRPGDPSAAMRGTRLGAAAGNANFADDVQTATVSLAPPPSQLPPIESALFPNGDHGTGSLDTDDSIPITSPDDYASVSREALAHWRARLKRATSVREQAAADVSGFMAGSARRRLRLVLVQLHDLLDRAPEIYELLERKQVLENSAGAQARLDRNLNALWAELKARCSLLVFDKEHPRTDPGWAADKAVAVHELVAAAMRDVAEHCSLLWDQFDDALRGLVFADSGQQTIEAMLCHAPGTSGEIQRRALQVLLGAYVVQPDLYRAAIKGVVEAVASSGARNARLVVSELRRHQALPGVLFRTLAACVRADPVDAEAVPLLDSVFCAGAAAWLVRRTGGPRPKYAAAGDEIRDAIQQQFFQLRASERRQQIVPFVRAVAGLVAYLRLDVQPCDYCFLKAAAELATDAHAAAACAALLLVLAGFGPSVAAPEIFDAIACATGTPAGRHVDCLLVYLKTDRIREVCDFITGMLGMDFAYPRDRLFYVKETVAQSGVPLLLDESVARRLISADALAAMSGARHTALLTDAVLHALQRAMFQDSGVDVRHWIAHLIRNADAATANGLGGLIRAYVAALFGSAAVTPIPEPFLWQLFAPEGIADPSGHSAPPAQVLGLLYIMHYNAWLLEHPRALGGVPPVPATRSSPGTPLDSSSQPRSPLLGTALGAAPGLLGGSYSQGLSLPSASGANANARATPAAPACRAEYSDQLLDALPVSWLLQCVARSPIYQQVWPELLAMATAQFPDQLDVATALQHELACNIAQGTPCASASGGQLPGPRPGSFADATWRARHLIAEPRTGVASGSPVWRLQRAIEAYAGYPASVRMETCGSFAGQLCRAAVAWLDNKGFVASVRQAWISLHSLNPHAVSAATANAWRSETEQAKPKLVPQDIWLDPLVILRSDTRVFQSADLVDILLTVLAESLTLSRTAMRRAFALRQRDGAALKRPHIGVIIQLQESAAVQLLIEAAAFAQSPDVQWLVFEFVHARFLEQRAIQKLVHFQAYDVAAIDGMVKHVPSMHACSEFIPELLMQSTPSLQLFAVRLATAIIGEYPIAANEGMAREVILPHVQTTLTQIAGTAAPDEAAVCDAMFEAVAAVGASFPPIRPACAQLAEAVKGAIMDLARDMFQPTQQQTPTQGQRQQDQHQQQQQRLARWIGCCEALLDHDGSAGATQPVRLDAVNVEKMVAKLEAQFKADSKAAAGRSGSPKQAEPGAAPASAGTQQPGAHGPPPGPQKRQHSMMAVDRGPRVQQPAQPSPGNGDSTSAGAPEPRSPAGSGDAASQNGAEPAHPPADASGGGTTASGLKKRARNRGQIVPGPVKPVSAGPKRGKMPRSERPPRAKDA